MVKADLTVGDEKFLELVTAELELPLLQPTDRVAPVDRLMAPRTGEDVAVRSGASEHAEIVGRMVGPARVDGRLGAWLRLRLDSGRSGWVRASELGPAGRAQEPMAVEARFANSPPVIVLDANPGGGVVVAAELSLTGTVRDDQPLEDLFVFGNDRKVSYTKLEGSEEAHRFSLDLLLEPGENSIEIFARDSQDHMGRLSFGVYRESVTADAVGGSGSVSPGPR